MNSSFSAVQVRFIGCGSYFLRGIDDATIIYEKMPWMSEKQDGIDFRIWYYGS